MPSSSPPFHHEEELPDGTTRLWMAAGQPYTETPEQQLAITEVITTTMQWTRPGETMPFMPGLLVQDLINRPGTTGKLVAHVGYSTGAIQHPDCPCNDPSHPDHWADFVLVGVRVRYRNLWWTAYWLDMGLAAVWVVSDELVAPMPPNVTGWCGMEWHERCRGRMGKGDDLAELPVCECSCGHPSSN